MAKYLVIVESPAKVKTISKFLGANYTVVASNGHVRDLPKSTLGVDVENDYEPRYITIRGKGDILAGLRKEVKKADKIYLATDPDREGEAISWHLLYALKLDQMPDKQVYRITFNEITKTAVKESLKNAREIDMNLVDAQQTRRILDRMVGYSISPLLWAKIKRGLSAGRVQSVTLRIIADREEEISAFIPTEYWTMDAAFKLKGEKKPLIARAKDNLANKDQVEAVKKDIEKDKFVVSEIKNGERTKKAPLPFTTSTLQQEASKALNFSTQKTMRLAQQLYEGVDIKGSGTIGLITYLRTDSTRISAEAKANANSYIESKFGKDYVASSVNEKKSNSNVQDAHEAIRPTDITREPAAVKGSLSNDLFKLYQLIWKRFVACNMTSAKYETQSVKITNAGHTFSASASKLVFPGFMSVYTEADDKDEDKGVLQSLEKGMVLDLDKLDVKQHFTEPPAHYTEASLVRTMEELGIGRPSTYAPTITIIQARRYISKENKNLYLTELGEVVNNMMKEAFPTIVDANFTANMETLLDGVATGDVQWKTIIRNFYPDLDEAVKNAEKELEHVKIEDEISDEVCEVCGRQMVIKYGPHGKFLACPGFPECRNTMPYFEKIGVDCPKCGKDVVIKKTKKGRRFYGCLGNPDCDFMVWQRPVSQRCEKCGNVMVVKGSKLACVDPECGFMMDRPKA